MTYKYWALQKAAFAIDELGESIENIYQNKGISGLMQIKGIGRSLANQIEGLLKGRI